jgi:hypothetical protein
MSCGLWDILAFMALLNVNDGDYGREWENYI